MGRQHDGVIVDLVWTIGVLTIHKVYCVGCKKNPCDVTCGNRVYVGGFVATTKSTRRKQPTQRWRPSRKAIAVALYVYQEHPGSSHVAMEWAILAAWKVDHPKVKVDGVEPRRTSK